MKNVLCHALTMTIVSSRSPDGSVPGTVQGWATEASTGLNRCRGISGGAFLLCSLFSQPEFPKVLLSLPKGFEPSLEAGAGIGTRERVFSSFQCECILLPPGVLEA